MLLTDDEIQERIESPLNLLNRLKSSLTRVSSNHSSPTPIPSLPPKAEDVIQDLEEKIKSSSIRSKALNIMTAAMDELKNKIPEVGSPERLSRITYEMSRVVFGAQEVKNANANANAGISQIIVYAPQVRDIEEYKVIDVKE